MSIHPGRSRYVRLAALAMGALLAGELPRAHSSATLQNSPQDPSSGGSAFYQSKGVDENGVTPLMRAARDGEPNLLRSILSEGGDVNSQDSFGWSALTYAARRGDAPMILALANKGADIDHPSEDGWTPLMYAASQGFSDAVRVLLDRGANVNANSNSGATALTFAEQRQGGATGPEPNGKYGSRTYPPRDYPGVVEQLQRAGAVAGRAGPLPQISPAVDSKPVALNRPSIKYTEEARQHKLNARIDMRVLVGDDGTVRKIRVLTGAPYGLTDQAVTAASQLRFKPASRGGKPVEFWVPLSMDFNIK